MSNKNPSQLPADTTPTADDLMMMWDIATGTMKKVVASDHKDKVTLSNPYKFNAYRSAALNAVSSTATKMAYDTDAYDTNSNFASGTYTAPVAGFYNFSARFSVTSTRAFIALYKNGFENSRGMDSTVSSSVIGPVVNNTISLAAGDTVEVYYFIVGTPAIDVGPTQNYFSGYLLSRT